MLALSPVFKPLRKIEFDTFDMEWFPGTYVFRCAAIRRWDGSKERFETLERFVECLFDRNRTGILYAHNMGKSDLLLVLEHMLSSEVTNDRDFDFDLRISCNTPIIAEITEKVGERTFKWTLRDSVRTWAARLEEIGSTLGMTKLDDWECDDKRAGRECSHKEGCIFYAPIDVLLAYCEHDTEILFQALAKLQDTLNARGMELRSTAASTSIAAIRRKYLRCVIPIEPKTNTDAREAYTGGRVEPPRRGRIKASVEKPIRIYDLTSAYPWAMTQRLPARRVKSGVGAPPDGFLFIADCVVEVPEKHDFESAMCIPPLPLKMEKGKRAPDKFRRHRCDAIVYPTGRWRAWYTSVDLEALLEMGGRVVEFNRWHAFESFTLANFANDVFKLRAKAIELGLDFETELWKLILNSGYGKLCEDPVKKTLTTRRGTTTDSTRFEDYPCSLAVDLYTKTTVRTAEHEHVPAGAFITSYVRRLLWQYCMACLRAGHPVMYMDTDSLTTTYDGLPIGGALGELKLEMLVYDLHIAAPKLYCVVDGYDVKKQKRCSKVRAKGFYGLRNVDDYFRVLDGGIHEWKSMVRLSGLLKDGRLTDIPRNRSFTGNGVSKRCFDANGWSRPWRYEETASLFDKKGGGRLDEIERFANTVDYEMGEEAL